VPKVTVERTELPIKLVHKCKRCGRPINHYGFGKKCAQAIIDDFKSKVPVKDYPVIYSYLKGIEDGRKM
jgi:hypothetical protein